MKFRWKTFLLFVAVPVIVGAVSGFISHGGMEEFKQLEKPALSPPGWLFPVVWTVLFILMGIASYLVFASAADRESIKSALSVYWLQLAVNFFWSIIFFNCKWFLFSFVWLVILWLLILVTTALFFRISKTAGWLMLPYLLWTAFAGYLNFGVYLLN